MGKILDDFKTLQSNITANAEKVLIDCNKFINLYDSYYVLENVKDVDYLKKKMKDKIEKGISNYDN